MYVINSITSMLNYCLDSSNINFTKIQHNFTKTMNDELNFFHEKMNSRKQKDYFRKDDRVYIPFVYDEVSSERVLTMEWVDGVKITERDKIEKMGLNSIECSRLMNDVFCKMIFHNGFIHCDPHPGNILIRRVNNRP